MQENLDLQVYFELGLTTSNKLLVCVNSIGVKNTESLKISIQ